MEKARITIWVAVVLAVFSLGSIGWAAELLVPSQYGTIQGAIDSASNGDVVVVADGTYAGLGNKNLDFGGRAITVRSANGPESTTIDCEEYGRGFYFHNGEGATSVVDGFTITNGFIGDTTSGAATGGAIRCAEQSSPTITNCIFTNNKIDYT